MIQEKNVVRNDGKLYNRLDIQRLYIRLGQFCDRSIATQALAITAGVFLYAFFREFSGFLFM